ncbi:MAG: beta-L-arabinofuranosidase domain-containing protein [Planctomycetota bacterium]
MNGQINHLMFGLALALVAEAACAGAEMKDDVVNLALFATPATSFVSGHETLDAINDGFEPRGMGDHSHGCYGNWPQTGTQWVELDWSQPVGTSKTEVYWWDDGRGVRLPKACRLLFWDGKDFVAVKDAAGLGVEGGRYNATTFPEVTTAKLRLEMDGQDKFSTGIIEWKVYDSGKSPKFAPHVTAGPDRVAVLPAKTYLHGAVRGPTQALTWSKAAGPGTVTFADAHQLETTAQFSEAGEYVLTLAAANGGMSAADMLHVRVDTAATQIPLNPVPTCAYKIASPLWSERLKQQLVNWIPHCIAKLSEPGLKEGGFENFVEAGNKNAGRAHKPHVGPPWANAYTLNTVESMCLALLVDAQGDAELARAQTEIRAKLDEWVPLILAAQEPDGYLQTRFTLGTPGKHDKPAPRWTHVGDHEGYVAGYFIEAAVAHFRLTAGRDRRMYDAARKLADCWAANIGPAPKKKWYDGHEEMEQALVRLARLVNEAEGAGQGDKYVQLARFLLDCRRNGESYDQSHLPVVQQYEALGHAVRAAYCYSAMADIAMETGDAEYHSAVKSLWNNIVNAKYYVTGGIGSGETSEGFGKNFSLPNNAYSESCSDCGELFFQHKMNLAYQEARYADLMEETLYNAILGSVDLPGKNFTYTNPLDQTHARYGWHGCPCCVGNIPRTLLMLPTWMYARNSDGVFVNLYIGSSVRVGADLEIVQRTDYPWKGSVEIAVNPAAAKTFALRLRAPNRNVSALYRGAPGADGITSLAVNGAPIAPEIKDGYAVITREWKAGDTVRLELPLRVQRVKADERIAADRGRVALRYGPLIYNLESVDQKLEGVLKSDAELTPQWEPNLLGGVVAIHGKFSDGSPLTAIPNYARNNRGGRSIVWIAAGD